MEVFEFITSLKMKYWLIVFPHPFSPKATPEFECNEVNVIQNFLATWLIPQALHKYPKKKAGGTQQGVLLKKRLAIIHL